MDSSSPYRHHCAKLRVILSVNDKDDPKMEIYRIGVDLAKNVFQLHGADISSYFTDIVGKSMPENSFYCHAVVLQLTINGAFLPARSWR